MSSSCSSHVVFLTASDIYKLLPDDDGLGGVAQFATLMEHVRAQFPRDAHAIVTINGDFLWRTELEPPYKAEMMIRMLELLGVEYVVLGNHEFDFGGRRCLELLPTIQSTVFGSNARLRETNELLPGVTDHRIITLPGSDIKIGLFGVLTSNRYEFVVPEDPLVVFESEIVHSKRCVRELQAAGAEVIVALTHTRLAKDRLIARQVHGIHLILGGHDHEASTIFEKTTLVHKSGCDGLWLAQVDCFITREREGDDTFVNVQFGWKMVPNRGLEPHPQAQKLLDEYFERVARDSSDPELEATLAVSRTRLDGTRVSLRAQETNLGSLVADAIRAEMDADIAFINAGFIQCERSYRSGLTITRKLLQVMLPIPNHVRMVAVSAEALRLVFLAYLRKYPDESSTMPHVSGLFLVFSLDFKTRARELRMFYDREHQREIANDAVLRVATSVYMFEEGEGNEHFRDAKTLSDGPIIRDLVAQYLKSVPNQEIAYVPREGRLIVDEN